MRLYFDSDICGAKGMIHRTKAQRSGHVFRVTLQRRVRFYRWNNDQEDEFVL